ncbi:MAG: V-type ATP synthase subunit D [Deltaproteobacteria bacterium]|nr:V-type ATP synthase subunit D [Deltaproteobacteria bacterium]
MEKISPTRMNLLLNKAQTNLARDGVSLLKNKRDALVKEFFTMVREMFTFRDELDERVRNAAGTLNVALAVDGPHVVRSVGMSTRREISIGIERRNVWGIRVPELEKKSVVRSVMARGYGIHTVSSRIDDAATCFEGIINLIITMASNEVRVKRVGDEIRKTTRRVNALEQVVIPGLEMQSRFIEGTLEEREREDLFRLKRLKKMREAKR